MKLCTGGTASCARRSTRSAGCWMFCIDLYRGSVSSCARRSARRGRLLRSSQLVAGVGSGLGLAVAAWLNSPAAPCCPAARRWSTATSTRAWRSSCPACFLSTRCVLSCQPTATWVVGRKPQPPGFPAELGLPTRLLAPKEQCLRLRSTVGPQCHLRICCVVQCSKL